MFSDTSWIPIFWVIVIVSAFIILLAWAEAETKRRLSENERKRKRKLKCGHTKQEHSRQANMKKARVQILSEPQLVLQVGLPARSDHTSGSAGIWITGKVLNGVDKLKGKFCVIDVTDALVKDFRKGSTTEAWYIGEAWHIGEDTTNLHPLFTSKSPCEHIDLNLNSESQAVN